MTDKTLNEYLAECAQWADQWAAGLRVGLDREAKCALDAAEIALPLSKARAERLIEGLEAIAALLRDLQDPPG
jgi:hypothetical protein